MIPFFGLISIFSIALCGDFTCEDTYVIEIPNDINIVENGTITINIIENDLNDNQTLHIDFDEKFTISDRHGKNDITGHIDDNLVSVAPYDTGYKQVHYYIDNIPAGEWNGHIGMNIYLENKLESNMLENGTYLNQLLRNTRPNYLEFSNNVIHDYLDVYDVSLAKDESILLYHVDSQNVIISNGHNERIKANSDMSELFKDVTSLSEIRNIDLVDFSCCEDISKMFYGANHLTSISGLNNISTSNIQNMSGCFGKTNVLKNIDLSNWNTINVTDMSEMFISAAVNDFSSIENWNTANVVNMSGMFSQLRQATSIDLSSWDVSGVEDMSNMFSATRKLSNINISSWSSSNCRNFSRMFEASTALQNISGISLLNTSKTTDLSYMFSNCTSLHSLEGLDNWDTEKVKDMSYMFNNAPVSFLGDISDWDVGNVESFQGMFASCQNISDFSDLRKWNVSEKCRDLSMMFYNTVSILPSYFDLRSWDVKNVETTANMFYGCKSVEYLDISGWDTGNLIDASGMFRYNTLTNYSMLKNVIGIEAIDTGKLKNISSMFMLNRYVNVDLSMWNCSNLEDISYAFSGCYRQDLDKLKHWKLSSVVNMSECFSDDAGTLSHTFPPEWYLN